MTNNIATTPLGIVCRAPLVLAGWWYSSDPIARLEICADGIRDQTASIIIFNAWSAIDRDRRGELNATANNYEKYRTNYPNHELLFAANDAAELDILTRFKLPAMTLNHNAFYINTQSFFIEQVPKRYNAIYNAQIAPYKRHELLSAINNACLIAASFNSVYYSRIKDSIKHCTFANGIPDRAPLKKLQAAEVNRLCCESKVGLCVSRTEGAMLASTEYLLCGIPVVTTKSEGGRDAMFSDKYVSVASDNPQAIADAVKQLADRNICPHEIREATVRQIFQIRHQLFAHLISRYAAHSVSIDELNLFNAIVGCKKFPWSQYTSETLKIALTKR